LVIADQGFGDIIQFSRYLPMVTSRCAGVILGAAAELGPLLARAPGVSLFCHRWRDVPRHAAHIRLASLPYVFQTELSTIPAAVPYLFPDAERQEVWKARLPQVRPLIGLRWAGSPAHRNDGNRSIDPKKLKNLIRRFAPHLVFLQQWHHLIDWGETAALIANLDLVISVDTAVAHLAGVLGKPVWILLPEPADWRWLLNRTDSPWYPTARLFRQPGPGDWDTVLEEVVASINL
jgi:hypothetical protein